MISTCPLSYFLINNETKKRLSQFELFTGDVIVARSGDLSKCAVVTKTENGWLCGTGSFYISLHESIQRNFFIHFFISKYTQNVLNKNSVGAAMANLNQKLLSNLIVPLSSTEEMVERERS